MFLLVYFDFYSWSWECCGSHVFLIFIVYVCAYLKERKIKIVWLDRWGEHAKNWGRWRNNIKI